MEYKRNNGETPEAFVYRVCSNKDKLGSWDRVADIINKELGVKLKPGTYRKKYQSFEKIFLGNKALFNNGSSPTEEIEVKIRELKEERTKLNDERAAYNRLIRDKSRNDSIYELFQKELKAFEPIAFKSPVYDSHNDDKEIVVVLSDVHAGNGANNYFNTYNNEIMTERFNKYLGEIKAIRDKYTITRCHLILLGDLINGNIHISSRIENRENIVKQIISVSEATSLFTYGLYSIFGNVNVYSVSGNHSRFSPNKAEQLKGENLDELIPFYLKAKFSNILSVVFYDNRIDESIGSFELCGKTAYFVHGDKDTVAQVTSKLTLMTGKKPDYVFMGHRHTNNLTTTYDTKVIESGCLSGSDSYCMDKRLRNKPEQAVVLCDDNGLYCYYDIKLD